MQNCFILDRLLSSLIEFGRVFIHVAPLFPYLWRRGKCFRFQGMLDCRVYWMLLVASLLSCLDNDVKMWWFQNFVWWLLYLNTFAVILSHRQVFVLATWNGPCRFHARLVLHRRAVQDIRSAFQVSFLYLMCFRNRVHRKVTLQNLLWLFIVALTKSCRYFHSFT